MYKIIEKVDNVFFENGEDFERFNESRFLRMVFQSLKVQMEDFYEYVFFILSSYNTIDLPISATYATNKKKVLLFISDESGVVPYTFASYYHAIFKIHLQTDKLDCPNIFPFPLGCVKDVPQLPVIPINERRYNVFFSGNLNLYRTEFYRVISIFRFVLPKHGIRYFARRYKATYTFLRWFKNNFDTLFPQSYIRFTDGFKQGLTPERYGQVIADSKIVLSPKGFFFSECFRHYEAMRAGCVIVSEKLPETYFYKDSPIIQIDNWEDGLKIVSKLINDKQKLETISREMQIWWKDKCSEDATAGYLKHCLSLIR